MRKEVGPSLLESICDKCLAYELSKARTCRRRSKKDLVVYHNIRFEIGFRADLIVNNKLLIEVKAIDQLLPVPPLCSLWLAVPSVV